MWIRLDTSLPVGPTGGTSVRNWSQEDPAPYGSSTWWYAGNFLIDGFNNGQPSAGTFSFQIVGAGRVRWTFGDGTAVNGGVLAVQARPSSSTPSLLDTNDWHHVAAVRRWQGTSEARLELWIDGRLIATETSPNRTNMRQWWNNWAGFPSGQAGWFVAAEKFSAQGGAYWDDYKGLVSELRFFDRAKTTAELQNEWSLVPAPGSPGFVGSFRMPQPVNNQTCDDVAASRCLQLVAQQMPIWTTARPPGH
jgi:hypothetical protein